MSVNVPKPDLHRILCQIYIAVEEVEEREFEILAMISEKTPMLGDEDVPSGPALRGADGRKHIKSAKERKGGFFPPKVAEVGAFIKLQDAGVSWESDKVSILNHIVQSDDPTREPPSEHAEYDRINCKVRGLFRGAAMYSYAIDGNTEKLRELLSAGTEEIDYQEPDGRTSTFMAAQESVWSCSYSARQARTSLARMVLHPLSWQLNKGIPSVWSCSSIARQIWTSLTRVVIHPLTWQLRRGMQSVWSCSYSAR